MLTRSTSMFTSLLRGFRGSISLPWFICLKKRHSLFRFVEQGTRFGLKGVTAYNLQTTFFNGRQQLKALSVLCRNGDSPKVRRRFGLGVLAVSGKAPAAGSAHRLLRTGG